MNREPSVASMFLCLDLHLDMPQPNHGWLKTICHTVKKVECTKIKRSLTYITNTMCTPGMKQKRHIRKQILNPRGKENYSNVKKMYKLCM